MTKILMIVTNTDRLGDHETGLWLSEFVEPATEFRQHGFDVIAASMAGGRAPIDPHSYSNELPRVWDGVMEPIHDTLKLVDVDPTEFAAVFLCGGHGAMIDFPENETLAHLLRHFYTEKKGIASVCHGPAGFVGVKDHNGRDLIKGRTITGFTNEEEQGTGVIDLIPFSLEDKLVEAGAVFTKGEPEEDYVEVDEMFVTGQNPKSSLSTAQALIKVLKN